MQGFGDTKMPLVSSFIELTGKVLMAWFLVPVIGYMGVIISEPVVWAVMVIPLVVGICRDFRKLTKMKGEAEDKTLDNLLTPD